MSSPPAGNASGGPGPNWYPDPSIPGYIRYWNGAAWVPGSSRPEPRDGEPMPAPPIGLMTAVPPAPVPPAPVPSPAPPSAGEESPAAPAEPGGHRPPSGSTLPELRRRGDVASARPGPGRDMGRDMGRDKRVTWGSDEDVSTSPVAAAGRVDPRGQLRRPPSESTDRSTDRSTDGGPDAPDVPGAPPRPPTPELRPKVRREIEPQRPEPSHPGAEPDPHEETVGLRRAGIPGAASWTQQVRELAQQQPDPHAQAPAQAPAQAQSPAPAAPPAPAPPLPPQPIPAQPHPAPGGVPGGYPYPAPGPYQAPGPVPPAADPPFARPGPFADAERQAYPAPLGRRLVARLVDSLLPLGAAVAVAQPLLGKARDHIQEQIDAANTAGVTRNVWLIDGTTGTYLAMVVGVFLGIGLLCEVLPTAIWGRSLGKALCRVRVLSLERQDAPGFGAALLRWLAYGLLAVCVIGIVNVLWCVRDRPWRQCWHDKAAGTYVAGSG